MNFDSSVLFQPSELSGKALRSHLNQCFASSFEHIFEACEPHFSKSVAATPPLLSRLRECSRENPYFYSLHFQLIDAIEENRLDDVEALIKDITNLPQAASGLLLTDLRPEVFPWDSEIVSKYFSAESASHQQFGAPWESRMASRQSQVNAAIDLLHLSAPGLGSEFEQLVTTLIIAQSLSFVGDDKRGGFGGASALRAFGGILLNFENEPTIVDCAATLIHEQAHHVLFALSPMEGVVVNSDEERFDSPLRDDVRPMEGIVHATFVLARMIHGMAQMRASGELSADDSKTADRIQRECIGQYFQGYQTVCAHARLTPQGEMAMRAAHDYMAIYDPGAF